MVAHQINWSQRLLDYFLAYTNFPLQYALYSQPIVSAGSVPGSTNQRVFFASLWTVGYAIHNQRATGCLPYLIDPIRRNIMRISPALNIPPDGVNQIGKASCC